MHKHHINVVQTKLGEEQLHSLRGEIITVPRGVDFRGEEDLTPIHSSTNCLLDGIANCSVVQVDMSTIDVSSTLEQIPKYRSINEDVVVCRGSKQILIEKRICLSEM